MLCNFFYEIRKQLAAEDDAVEGYCHTSDSNCLIANIPNVTDIF